MWKLNYANPRWIFRHAHKMSCTTLSPSRRRVVLTPIMIKMMIIIIVNNNNTITISTLIIIVIIIILNITLTFVNSCSHFQRTLTEYILSALKKRRINDHDIILTFHFFLVGHTLKGVAQTSLANMKNIMILLASTDIWLVIWPIVIVPPVMAYVDNRSDFS